MALGTGRFVYCARYVWSMLCSRVGWGLLRCLYLNLYVSQKRRALFPPSPDTRLVSLNPKPLMLLCTSLCACVFGT